MSLNELLNYDYSRLAFWFSVAGVVILAAAMMMVLGVVWLKSASKKYRCFYGYKTAVAKSDKEAWIYVNRIAGRLPMADYR